MNRARAFRILVAVLVVAALTACTGATAVPSPASSSPVATPAADVACALAPIVVPTMPEEVPGYTALDSATGLHMTGTPQLIDLESYRLEVTGLVDTPQSLTYDQLRCLPKVEAGPELVCPGFFVDEASWAGTPILDVLALAGVQDNATRVRLVSADGYGVYVALANLEEQGGFLAYEWEGEPLPILHGFPVRAVLPGQTGGLWVKWLVGLEVVGLSSPPPADQPAA